MILVIVSLWFNDIATVHFPPFHSFIIFSRNLYVKKILFEKYALIFRWYFQRIFFFLSSLHLSFTCRFYKIVKGGKKKKKKNKSISRLFHIYIRIGSKRNRSWNRIRGPARETWRVSIDSYWKVYFNREER